MKKNILIFLSVLLIILAKAQTQNVSDYQYVVIPQEFNDFKNIRAYNLTVLLENSLKSKKYLILPDTKAKWPSDALVNPCKVVNADLLDDKSMFRNKVILEFKDCNNQVIFTQKGGSTIKEFEPGFQDALKQALLKIPVSNPSSKVEKLVDSKPSEEIKTNEGMSQTPIAQKYIKGSLSLQKIQIDDSQFILVDGNSSVPYATFKATTKKDVFRVKLNSGESTIGYYENGNIVIETPKNNGEFSKDTFFGN